MNKRFLSVVLFALLFSGAASVVLYKLVIARIGTNAKSGDNKLVAAARNIDIGTLVRDTDVKTIEWNGAVPPHALKSVEDVVGRGTIAPLFQGELVLDSRLAPKGGGAGLAAMIPQGKRAVAVRVNEVVGVAGFAVPGMKVDVLISGRPPGSNSFDGGTQTKTILQNIEVLSAGQNFQKDAEGKPVTVQVINLVATPQQAEILSLASNDAKIQLVLRNPLDKEETNTPGTALASLFSGRPVPALAPARPAVRRAAPPPPKVEPPPPPKPQMKVVEVIHGMKNGVTKAEAKFEKPSEVLP